MAAINQTYGLLEAAAAGITAGSTDSYKILPSGTDLIITLSDGTVASYSPGDLAWILTASALVWLMMPGLGFLYSGLVRRKNALSLLLMPMLALAVISVQWYLIGYSLAFSDTGGPFIGDLKHAVLRGVMEQPIPQAGNKIPAILYYFYQNMFAALVPAIAIGAAAERGRIGPTMIFVFFWSTIVYCPVAHWIWAPGGWAFQLGVLDYAGGGPVEILSGVTGLTYSIYIGKRRGFGTERLAFKPHNISHVYLGLVLLWVGWLGFNGGSTFAANLKACLAIVNTNIAGAVGSLTWLLMDWRLERKWSAVGWITGAVAGLVGITPAAGFVGVGASIFIGFICAFISNLLTSLKGWVAVDDAMDIYAVHGVAGIVGLIFTGVFAQANIAAYDGFSVIPGGWLDGNYIQVGYQLGYSCAVGFYCFVVTYSLMFIIDHIPYCHLRSSVEAEIIGIDEDQAGEWAYDYACLQRDLEGNYRSHPDAPMEHENAPSEMSEKAASASLEAPTKAEGTTLEEVHVVGSKEQ